MMKFEKPLREGVVVNRPNRFIMNVLVDGVLTTCHCPCTGRIARVIFDGKVPCLLRSAEDEKRRTRYTVEAISLNEVNDPHKKWIGINQTRANNYIDYFLRSGQLSDIIGLKGKDFSLKREQRVGESRLDFVIDDEIYLEVKSPMVLLPLRDDYVTGKYVRFTESEHLYSIDRFIKHMGELSKHKRAIILVFFMFEADIFDPKPDENSTVGSVVQKTRRSGVEFWQVNAKFTEKGISLVDYYRMPS
ncbi:MAG: DNA/RNA nuclease SfsA [Rickettsiales bacterium]|jgi:sugar fermentation stimulation protein A|nr:DNA/RNA nuclease SfsA [Rickettsiales bacterium]